MEYQKNEKKKKSQNLFWCSADYRLLPLFLRLERIEVKNLSALKRHRFRHLLLGFEWAFINWVSSYILKL